MDANTIRIDSSLSNWLEEVAKRSPKAVAEGLRAGAGYYANTARRLMTQFIHGAGSITAQGAFKGRRMTDAVFVKATPADLMVEVYLNTAKDARVDWLNSGTAPRYTGAKRRKKQRSFRGVLKGTHYFDAAVSHTAEAYRIIEAVTLSELAK